MDWLTGVLGSLQGGSAVVLGLVIGVMTAFDMGGPINKTASTFTMAIMASGIYGPNGMFVVGGKGDDKATVRDVAVDALD